MRVLLACLTFSFWIAGSVLADTPEKALCSVCAINGETELEKVAATREYKAKTYYFCSDKCADEFDANPSAYVFEGGAAPATTWTTIAGETVSLESLRGKVVLLDFWATWCKPCVKTMPDIDALYRQYREQGLAVIGISVDQGDDRDKKVRKFLDKKPVSYPIAIDSKESASWESFNVAALPTLYLVDREGNILQRWTGAGDMAAMRAAVERALGVPSK